MKDKREIERRFERNGSGRGGGRGLCDCGGRGEYHNATVQPKKSLGQHFLRNTAVAERIAQTVGEEGAPLNVLEIGPGMGILTQFLWQLPHRCVKMVELDRESVAYLQANYPDKTGENDLFSADFLRMNLNEVFPHEAFCLIGNYPYNISSQILFKAVDFRERIPLISGMFQKEVAERVAAGPGSKTYGILSVWVQAFYDTEYLFTVEPCEFNPPPKVRSGVIRLRRKENYHLPCNEKLFLQVVKAAFGQRRKTLRNALGAWHKASEAAIPPHFLSLRAEQLSVADFVEITQAIEAANANIFYNIETSTL